MTRSTLFDSLFDDGAVSTLYQVSGIPTSIFVDANGIVRDMHTGTMPDAQQFLDKIPY